MPTTRTRSGPPIRRPRSFRDVAKRTLTAGGLGSVGEKAATAIADFVVLDMFANYCTGREDVKGAITIAERQLQAHLSLDERHAVAAGQRSVRAGHILGLQ